MTHWCNHCDREFSNPRCPRCGGLPTPRGRDHDDPAQDRPILSDPLSTVETDEDLVERTARPSLASLVKAGLKQGIIHVIPEYVAGKRRS